MKRNWTKAFVSAAIGLIGCCMAYTGIFAQEIPGEAENRHKILIDPGHQGSWVNMSDPEPIAPGSSETKAKATTGTSGRFTGVPEYKLVLDIGLQLQEELINRGYEVVMTREDHNTAISNSQRAQLASETGCEISVRLHANGSDDSSVNGALAMVMTPDNPWVGDLYTQSSTLAEKVLTGYCEETGFQNLGIQYYDNMTGINWSKVPVVILEMGFMTNQSDDIAMEDPAMQKKMIKGIADGIDGYFGIEGPPGSEGKTRTESQTENQSELQTDLPSEDTQADSAMAETFRKLLAARELAGEKWSVSYMDLQKEEITDYQSSRKMLSASVIKVFIMGAVYDRICYPKENYAPIAYWESYEGELRSLLENMIRVSDNDAANRLVTILGEGSFENGMAVVNDFCERNGFAETSLGRAFMGTNENGDNYTSARDCREILRMLYEKTLVCEEASAKMMTILQGQTLTYKIPAVLPAGYTSANKTGEMPEGYGLGCIENDIAIVFSPSGDYVLAVLSNDLGGRNSEAQMVIQQLSSAVVEARNQAGN